jgi:serine/threonine protein kinase
MSETGPSLEEHLFDAASSKASKAERAAFLDGVCRDNPALRARLEVLLEGHFRAQGFLADRTKKIEGKPAETPAEIRCERIGRYKLLQPIGEGGCGIVYIAEQQEPVRRRVAIKVIKLGMDTKQVIARFEAERQALAMMDHPNIAKVLDAGATDTGRPYFVMDLVKGVAITHYCDENRLTPKQRLSLFVQVCQAVQHAHQKGVIHRDLKPSNILVADHDGTPVPKVIDFGIAKATSDQRLTDKTLFTAFELFVGTPAYMSPEQAKLSGLDVDTRSDIYSLGALLYELLTGKTPFEPRRLLEAGLDEIRRTIQEVEPVPPSTRLSAMGREELTITARHRRAEPPRLVSLVRGDLDWIVMKCLEKDRARRYETANGLTTDVQRYLNNDPVIARPPSRLYRLGKLVRRNKLAFAAGALVLASLVIGLGVSALMFFKESQARARAVAAEREQSRLRDQAERIPGLIFAAQGLRNKRHTEQPNPSKLAEEEDLYREALALSRNLYGDDHIEVVYLLVFLGSVINAQGRLTDAEHCYREALAISARLARANNPSAARMSLDGSFRLSVPALLDELTGILRSESKLDEVEQVYAEYLPLLRARLPADDIEVAHAVDMLTVTLLEKGKFAEAEPLATECLALYNKQNPDDWHVSNSRHLLGASLLGQKQYARAEPLLLSGYEGIKQRDGTMANERRQRFEELLRRMVQLYEETNRPDQAVEWKRKLLEFESSVN